MARKSAINPRLGRILIRIAHNVERIRKQQSLTQAEASERLGGDLRWFQRIESGKYVLSLDTISRLAKAFRVDESEFFKKTSA